MGMFKGMIMPYVACNSLGRKVPNLTLNPKFFTPQTLNPKPQKLLTPEKRTRKSRKGMAGDGGNDCGGLRAAHAGLALSDAEASSFFEVFRV